MKKKVHFAFLMMVLFMLWNCKQEHKEITAKTHNMLLTTIEDSAGTKFISATVWDNGDFAGEVIVGCIMDDKTNKLKYASIYRLKQSDNAAKVTDARVDIRDEGLYIRAKSIPIRQGNLTQFAESMNEVLLKQQANGRFDVLNEDAKMSDPKRTGVIINRNNKLIIND
jgi:hypothetical protein